ncbi:efflux transporter outer membrane subunit [Novosphingobium terrae]|uniref:efflux transporter outer membrane subunit n=1 Tax=Novosphingobium terrae TaxID=2726189 RepID=UPI00197E3A0A|nr:efflux transporter outer membrane subunit [Novosphingobium terrae]
MRRFPLSLALLALSACSTTQEAPPPAMALPVSLGTPGLAETEAYWPDAEWWHGFGSEELDGLVAQALDENTDIAAAMARIDQARGALRIARAPQLPAVNLSAQGLRQGANSSSGASSGNFAYAEVAASWEADLWGRLRAQARSARASLAVSRFDAQAVRLSVAAQVVQGWLTLMELRERQALARADLEAAQGLLAQTRALLKTGEALPGDVAAQRALVAQVEAQMAALERAENEARVSLAILLGRPAQGFAVRGAGLEAITMPTLPHPGLPAQLLTRRPDVAAAEAALAASGADVAAARAAMLPRITLSASGGGQVGTGPSEALYTLMAGLAQPLFDHGALAGQRDSAIARRREREADYRKAVLTALGDVERSLKATRQFDREVAARQEAAEQAQSAVDQAKLRYTAGKEDITAILAAQRTLFAARDALASARAEQLREVVALDAALGGGWRV